MFPTELESAGSEVLMADAGVDSETLSHAAEDGCWECPQQIRSPQEGFANSLNYLLPRMG